MEKFGFHKVTNNPGPGNPVITHNQPVREQAPVPHFKKQLRVEGVSSNLVALSNLVGVNPQDFPEIAEKTPVSIDGSFVFSITKDPAQKPGTIGLFGVIRQWVKASLGQPVVVEPYNIFDRSSDNTHYLGEVDLMIDFRQASKAHASTLDEEDLINVFISNFENQILQPTQPIVMDYKGVVYSIYVYACQVINLNQLGQPNRQMSQDFETKGILMKGGTQINFFPVDGSPLQIAKKKGGRSSAMINKPRANPIINPDFKLENMGIGGLDAEFQQIFRRAFASRIVSPDLVDKLGLRHVKGLLLYGPPGTGKTLIARQIGKMLNVKEPKIVNGPEMLSKYVGSSEENIRNLFKEAEAEYKAKGESSQLHIIIFDELDSVFKQRGGARSDGTGVGDNVVNQLLAKMDGVEQLNNILIIGMTNRLDLIDNALLRPGRFEIQIEISLPDEKGRKEILYIHTKKMKDNDLLSDDIDFDELASLTKNFTGAELEGLCNSASSFAINQYTKGDNIAKVDQNIENMKLTRNDFLLALNEVKPAFGVNEEDLNLNFPYGIIEYNPRVHSVFEKLKSYVEEVKNSDTERLISVLLHGEPGVGKTAIASMLALKSEFPFIKMLSAESLVGMSEGMKINAIDNIFRDVYKSPLNVLVIDKIETLINYVPIGPRFSNDILQMLIVNLNKKPPGGRRLLIIGTTSQYSVLKHMSLVENFTKTIELKKIKNLDEVKVVFEELEFMLAKERQAVLQQLATFSDGAVDISIKKLIQVMMNCKYLKADVDLAVENIMEAQVA
ncbi:CIC11C00000000640 [Sungouiella intermedia]|uniref:Vesicular-fusion protein SEC18 n=1 Tax=Sungouiella intermedia TaxID=45354 RepID=A0A1L0D2H3_9ASCO|nr:CIC11C00000000640 [[Candida] intermedia]